MSLAGNNNSLVLISWLFFEASISIFCVQIRPLQLLRTICFQISAASSWWQVLLYPFTLKSPGSSDLEWKGSGQDIIACGEMDSWRLSRPRENGAPPARKLHSRIPPNPEYFQDLLWAHSFHSPRFRTAWILCLYTREKSLHSMIIHARRNGSTVRRPRYWLCCALPVGRGSRRAQWCCQALLLLSSFTWHVPVMCRETLWAWACLPANSVCSAGICQCCLLYKSQFRHGPC